MGRLVLLVVVAGAMIGWEKAGEVKVALTGDNTVIKFQCSKPGTTHVGGFKALTGAATFDGKDPATLMFVVDIDTNSIYTDTDGLTTHLKSADFFNVKANPKSKFTSTKVEKDGANYKVTGKLTMAGKTSDVSFPATMDVNGSNLTMKSNFKINRHNWGISYKKGFIIDDVTMDVNITAKKK